MTGRIMGLAIVASMAALAFLASRLPAQAPATAARPAAVVNGEPISMAEVETIIKAQGPTAVKLTEAQEREMRREIVSMLVDDLVMQQFLRQNAPKADLAEVNKQMAELDAGLKKQGKGLQDYLREAGQTEAQLRTDIAAGLQWRAFAQAHIAEEDLKRYYDENRDFFDGVIVRASHIVLRLPPNAAEGDVQAARQKLLALRQEIISGKLDFAEAAKKNSQCISAPEGGDIGKFPRKGLVEEPFAKAAYAMKVGEVSDVVRTDYGLHLIKVTERNPGQPSDYMKIKDDVKQVYIAEMRLAVLAQQRKLSKLDINVP